MTNDNVQTLNSAMIIKIVFWTSSFETFCFKYIPYLVYASGIEFIIGKGELVRSMCVNEASQECLYKYMFLN